MLDDAFADCQRQVESAKRRITQFEVFNDAQSMQVVIEAQAVTTQRIVQSAFTRMPKGRMANVMHQRQGFGEIFVEPQRRGNRACNLRDFHRVRQAAAKMIGVAMRKDLCLARETAKGTRMNNASAIALEG